MNVQDRQSQIQTSQGDGDDTTVEGEHMAAQAQNVAFGEQSPLLAETISERIPPHHQALVSGMFSLYEVLISMRHISRSDIYCRPILRPYSIRSNGFRGALSKKSSTSWLSSPLAFTYAGNDDGRDARDLRFQGENDIEPWTIRITNGKRDGDNYIYNTCDGTITIWNMYDNPFPDPSYHSLPARSAAEIFSEWIDKFITLTWIPWHSTREAPHIATATNLRPATETALRALVADPTSNPFNARLDQK
ncbi:MAG: hypothetical protein M1830_002718 [Pleopsidium flavum]|nr:MAG: hypothetical protein M1830_002718 [Pleopsidium flavum]